MLIAQVLGRKEDNEVKTFYQLSELSNLKRDKNMHIFPEYRDWGSPARNNFTPQIKQVVS